MSIDLMKESSETLTLIGRGAQADVYFDGKYARKVFHKDASKEAVFYEAMINAMIERLGIPLAKVYEVIEADGRYAMKMDYIRGKDLNLCMLEDGGQIEKYMNCLIKLQTSMHTKTVELPRTQRQKLYESIVRNDRMTNGQKEMLSEAVEQWMPAEPI